MAGTVVVDAVKSSTTGAPTFQNTSGTEIGQLCRAWVNFNGTTGGTIRASFNVSSVTVNSTGDYTVYFTSAMPDGNFSAVATCTTSQSGAGTPVCGYYATGVGTGGASAFGTAGVRLFTKTTGFYNTDVVSVAFFR